MKQKVIRDKTGHEWVVEIDEQFGNDELPLTFVSFYLFQLSRTSNEFNDPVGRGYLSIKGKDTTVAKIEDLEIDAYIEDRGLGTALLALIESWARNNGVNKLNGDLSDVDVNHIDKLKHFYSKNGYIFKLYQNSGNESPIFIGEVEKSIQPGV